MDLPPPIVTQEVRIVDASGQPRIVMSAETGNPTIQLFRDDGTAGATLQLNAAGRPALTLSNPVPDEPNAAIEIDDKGAHVKFGGKGDASSYLFLNNAGGSGVVLVDVAGTRRFEAVVAPDGTTTLRGIND